MQRVMSHAKEWLWNDKNKEKNGTRFFSTVPLLRATVLLLVERVTNKSHYRGT